MVFRVEVNFGGLPCIADFVEQSGDQDGAIQELATVTDLFGAGVQHQVRKDTQRAGAPVLELGIGPTGCSPDPQATGVKMAARDW